jgi:hypothetical protein
MTNLYAILVVVIDGDGDDPAAAGLIIWVVELRHIGMPQSLSSADALAGVELRAHSCSESDRSNTAAGTELLNE